MPQVNEKSALLAIQKAHAEGRQEMAVDILSWLEKKYIDDPEAPDRGSPEAKALLGLARELAKHIRSIS